MPFFAAKYCIIINFSSRAISANVNLWHGKVLNPGAQVFEEGVQLQLPVCHHHLCIVWWPHELLRPSIQGLGLDCILWSAIGLPWPASNLWGQKSGIQHHTQLCVINDLLPDYKTLANCFTHWLIWLANFFWLAGKFLTSWFVWQAGWFSYLNDWDFRERMAVPWILKKINRKEC